MGFLEDRDLSDVPTIPEYFKGKSIFITGGSGFIGKVLIEKLLYSCTELDRIYLLMRSKRGVQAEDRLAKIYSYQCFDRLRTHKPGVFKSKVFVINGDVMEDDLGLSSEDRALLVANVNVIFHVAASVRFDDPITHAAKMNLSGTLKILELAKDMRNLSALVHVSTSFCNNNQKPTREIMYPPHGDWRDTLQVCKDIDIDTLRIMTPKYINNLPNTYLFTKQLAEHMVYEQRGELPIVIVRPSIVSCALEEPMPGWVDNFNGPIGLIAAGGKGILRVTYAQPDVALDFVPVDTCVKSLIAAAWIRGIKRLEPSDDIPIYNCCANDQIHLTIQDMSTSAMEVGLIYPVNDIVWEYSDEITSSILIYYIKMLLTHLLPALIIDSLLWIFGKAPMLTKIHRRIYTATMALRPFSCHQWKFDNTNHMYLNSRIKTKDIEEFGYTLENFDKGQYVYDSCVGGRRYLLKEKDEDLPKARDHYKRIKILAYTVKTIFYGYLGWKLLNLFAFQSDSSFFNY